ncbi:MAG TPA: MFS transporter [Candidatus Saccharimonadia bacterium]|nr:MFS transporter [Candidatus Saccharimonadia bacterium]
MKQRAFRAFRNPVAASASLGANFNRLWIAQALSQVAQNLLNFALIIRVFQLAQGTRFANVSVALLILSFGVPSIFFAAAAGVYVDHWNKKVVLVTANFARAVLVLGYLLVEHNLLLVLILSFMISSITQFFAPAEAASIPSLVKPARLLRANSLFVFTLYASFIVGYSASAPVIALIGPHGPYFATSLFFLLAGVLVSFLPAIHTKESRSMPFAKIVRYTGHEILRNWELIRTNHNLSFPILQLTITQACLGVLLALAPALAIAVLHKPIQDTSQYLIIPAGVGMVAGVIAISQLVKYYSKSRVIAVGLIIASAALILLGLSSQLSRHLSHLPLSTATEIGLIVAALILILGFMNAVVSAASQTILQENTTDETRGKVYGALNMMVNIAATAPIFFAATIAGLTSVNTVITALGCLLLVFAAGQYGWLKRHQKLA